MHRVRFLFNEMAGNGVEKPVCSYLVVDLHNFNYLTMNFVSL